MKNNIPDDLKAGHFPQIIPKVHKSLLKKALLSKQTRENNIFNFNFIKKPLFLSGIVTVSVLILLYVSLLPTQNNFSPELKILIAKAQTVAEEKSTEGKYYHQKYLRSFPTPTVTADIKNPTTYGKEMIETWENTDTKDFIVLNKDLKTGKTYGSMSKNKEYFLFNVENGKLDLRSQGTLIEDKRIFYPNFQIDYSKTVGEGLQAVINGNKNVASLKDLFPYSDLTKPYYAGITEIDGKKLEGLFFEGLPTEEQKSKVEFYFDPETFQLQLMRTSTWDFTKGYTDEKGKSIQLKEAIFSESFYQLSEYINKPLIEIGGKNLEI